MKIFRYEYFFSRKKCIHYIFKSWLSNNLVAVGQTTHTAHYAQHVVVGGVYTHLSGLGTRHGRVGQHQLESGVVDAAEVARARRLVLLRAESEGVHVDTSVGVAGVVLVGLHQIEVGTLTLREAVLTVELQLGNNNGVLTPAVHVQSGLGKHESTSVRHSGLVASSLGVPLLERRSGGLSGESGDGVRQGINGISVVERLGTQSAEQRLSVLERRAVVNVSVRLDNPYELLARMVEVQLDLVRRGTYRLITSELELLDEVLMRVLSHTAALISIQEDVVDVQRRGDQRLVVGVRHLSAIGKAGHGPQALINRAQIKVDLHLMVLEGNQRQGKTRVTAEPELERHVQSGLGESLAGRAHLLGRVGRARTIDIGVRRVGHVGQLGGVTHHLVVTTLGSGSKSQLVPDVHPVTVLTIDTLSTDLYLYLRDELLTREIQPASVHITRAILHVLVNLGQSHLQVGAVRQITITADSASHTATEIGLSVECLLDRLHSEVSVATVGHLPESNLRVTSQVYVLSTVSDKLHKSTSHGYTIAKEKKTTEINRDINILHEKYRYSKSYLTL